MTTPLEATREALCMQLASLLARSSSPRTEAPASTRALAIAAALCALELGRIADVLEADSQARRG